MATKPKVKPTAPAASKSKASAKGGRPRHDWDDARIKSSKDSALELRFKQSSSLAAVRPLMAEWLSRRKAAWELGAGPRSGGVFDKCAQIDEAWALELFDKGIVEWLDTDMAKAGVRAIAEQRKEQGLAPMPEALRKGMPAARPLADQSRDARAHACALAKVGMSGGNDQRKALALFKSAKSLGAAKGELATALADGLGDALERCPVEMGLLDAPEGMARIAALAKAGLGIKGPVAEALGKRIKTAVAHARDMRVQAERFEPWAAAAQAAIIRDEPKVLSCVARGMVAVDSKALHARHLSERKAGYKTIVEWQTLLGMSLRQGSYQCAKALIDMGAGEEWAQGALEEGDNPFVGLRSGVVKYANSKTPSGKRGLEEAKAMFSLVAVKMAKVWMSKGLDVAQAREKVEQAGSDANKRLSRGSSKAAFEKLLLSQSLELARLGADGEIAPEPERAKRASVRL